MLSWHNTIIIIITIIGYDPKEMKQQICLGRTIALLW